MLPMYRPVKTPPDARILKKREYEDKLARIQTAVEEDSKLGAAAVWEVRADDRIKQNVVQQRFEALRVRRDARLVDRRERLAAKLQAEEQQLKQELVNSQETPAERRVKVATRAREMAMEREAKRQQSAAELLEQAFRENCDLLRERQSHRIQHKTAQEREQQLQEKMAMHHLEEEEGRMFDAMYKTEWQRKEQRHLDDMQRKQHGAGDVKRSLDIQVAAVRERQLAERQQDVLDVRRMQEHWARLEAEAEAADMAERHRLQQLGEEVREFNALKLLELNAKERQEREQDLAILQEALAREAAEEAADVAACEAKRQAVLHYRQQLALMMAKEEKDKGEQDAMIEAAQRRQQAKQDAEWAARGDARKRLMEEVDNIRRQQIAAKEHAKFVEKEQQKLDLLQIQEDKQQEAAGKAARAAEAQRHALKQQLDIKTQMMAHAHMKAAEQQEKLHAAELAVQSEQRYMERVAAAEHREHKFHRKKVEWYH